MNGIRYLTKSRFKLGMECPTKLFYTRKEEIYADQNLDDLFLAELANGGFQVGELAKQYFPEGIEVEGLDYEATLRETYELLEQTEATIFEAAVSFANLFIRVDVLRKHGSVLDVIEVKSKSCDGPGDNQFLNSDGTVSAGWLPYLYDIAFQKYVVQNAFPEATVRAFLMLADKSRKCPSDGLNQKFRIAKDADGRKHAVVAGLLSAGDLFDEILTRINVDQICELIYENRHLKTRELLSFEQTVAHLADHYARDTRIVSPLTSICRGCQFTATDEQKAAGFKSGFEECWKERLGWNDRDFSEPTVLDIWNFPGKSKDELLRRRVGRMSELRKEDITPVPDKNPGKSTKERQWLQVEKVKNSDRSAWIDIENLAREFSRWKFPLHFIDFETSMAAVPFIKGHRPYEPIAFQFSHHIIREDGSVEHAGEYLNAEPAVFPNFDFLRALKAQLENDEGTIFRYAAHENTYLNSIFVQLTRADCAVPDSAELIEFLQSISKSKAGSVIEWEGRRNMVDMLQLVKRFYYDPYTNGSNSIKAILPAVMQRSGYLKEKYSKPIYGAEIPSFNFKNWTWFQINGRTVVDPYKLLPKMLADVSDHDYRILSETDEINEGGAAMAAYAKLQFEDMSDYERNLIKEALLRYCETDTLAMVMIYEAWREMIG